MKDDWRETISKLLFAVGAMSLALFGGTNAPLVVLGMTALAWVTIGVRTGWWPGVRDDVDKLVISFMRRMRFYKDLGDEITAAEQPPTQQDRPQPQPRH